MRTWQESILMDLYNPDHRPDRVYSYVFPRQVGASTFLRDVAFQEAENGNKVFVIASGQGKEFLYNYNHPNIQGYCTRDALTIHRMMQKFASRPMYYDLLIIDCIQPDSKEPLEISMNFLRKFAKKILYINTTEGR